MGREIKSSRPIKFEMLIRIWVGMWGRQMTAVSLKVRGNVRAGSIKLNSSMHINVIERQGSE